MSKIIRPEIFFNAVALSNDLDFLAPSRDIRFNKDGSIADETLDKIVKITDGQKAKILPLVKK